MRIPLLSWFCLVTIAGCSWSLCHLFLMGLSCLLPGLGYFLGQSWQATKMDHFQPPACLCLACQLRIAAVFPDSYISTHSVLGLTSWLTNPKNFPPCSFILLTSAQSRSHSWLVLRRACLSTPRGLSQFTLLVVVLCVLDFISTYGWENGEPEYWSNLFQVTQLGSPCCRQCEGLHPCCQSPASRRKWEIRDAWGRPLAGGCEWWLLLRRVSVSFHCLKCLWLRPGRMTVGFLFCNNI